MTILTNSRYEGVPITGIKQTDGTIRSFLHDRVLIQQDDIGEDFTVDEFITGEELDLLAFDRGGKARLFWAICDINDIIDPHEPIPKGTKIKIPNELFFASR